MIVLEEDDESEDEDEDYYLCIPSGNNIDQVYNQFRDLIRTCSSKNPEIIRNKLQDEEFMDGLFKTFEMIEKRNEKWINDKTCSNFITRMMKNVGTYFGFGLSESNSIVSCKVVHFQAHFCQKKGIFSKWSISSDKTKRWLLK